MTTEMAVQWFESRSKNTPMPAAREAYRAALDALKEKKVRESGKTNGDRIRRMNDKELAKTMYPQIGAWVARTTDHAGAVILMLAWRAAAASDEHAAYHHMRVELSNFAWRAKMVNAEQDDEKKRDLAVSLAREIAAYGKLNGLIRGGLTMTLERAIRLAREWASGGVCTVREGEAQEYHKMALAALEAQRDGMELVVRCRDCRWSKQMDDREPKYACNNICRFGCTQWLDSNDFCSYWERKDENNEH